MSFTVTAAQTAAPTAGMSMTCRVVTGAASSPVAGSAGASSTTTAKNISYTPAVLNSLIFGALMGLSGTWTAESANSPFYQNSAAGGVQLIQFVTSSASSSTSTPLTLGATTSDASRDISVLEIAPGSGSLAIDGSSPSPSAGSVETLTTAAFTPPAGSLLVLMISSNGGAGTTTFGITDTSGLGLTWTEQSKANATNFGYTGVWTAPVPGAVNPGAFMQFF